MEGRARHLGDIECALSELVADLDPDAVPLCEAPAMWEQFDRVERLAASAKILLARRVDEAGKWQRDGFRSAAEQMALTAGTSVSSAQGQLDTSKRVEKHPKTAQAMRRGELSAAKAKLVAGATKVAPDAEDELLALAKTATREGPGEPKRSSGRYLGLIRADLEAMQRGHVEGDEICEIAGLGPIPVRVAKELLGDAVLKLVITKGVDVANVTHLGRAATIAQKCALWWRSPECDRLGCTRTQRLQIDHDIGWTKTHSTRVDDSNRLCDHDHDLKTYFGWALVEGTGKREMVPPDDPRHPKNKPKP